MSNSLTSLVPVLDGSNYTAWGEPMQAYLMAQGQWYTVKETAPSKPKDDASAALQAEYKSWKDDNLRAMGNISLRCTPSVRQYLKNLTTADKMWDKLFEEFGKPGLAAIFAEFKSAIELNVPASQNPQTAIQKLNEHFERLTGYGVTFPTFVYGMLLASKAPTYADVVIQMIAQTTEVDKVDAKAIGQAMVNSREQKQGRRKETPTASKAARITAIKRKPGEPNFNKQQQNM